MATRPTIPINVRASNSTYTTGPAALIGSSTKIARAGSDISEGYKVDSPLGTFPVNAQEVNFEDNRNDQWVEWVSLGSATADGDTHIVETDSGGDINTLVVNCIEVNITPNTGTDAIEITTNGGSKGLEVNQSASNTDFGVSVVAVDGSTAAAINIATRSSIALQVDGGDSPAVLVDMTSNGGAIGPSIKMVANTIEPTDDGAGTLWNKTISGVPNLKAGMGASGPGGFVIISSNASCYAKSTSIVDFSLTGAPTNQTIASIFTWSANMLPQAADQVRVTIWGRVAISNNQTNLVSLKVRDRTEVVDPIICEMTIENDNTGGANFLQTSATFSQIYTLPLLGTRNFDLVWSGNIGGGSSGLFNGYVEIEQLRG